MLPRIKHHFVQDFTPPTISRPKTSFVTSFVRFSEESDTCNKRKMRNAYDTELAVLKMQCALPAAGPRLPMLGRVFHAYSAGLPTQWTKTTGLTSQNLRQGMKVINRSAMLTRQISRSADNAAGGDIGWPARRHKRI